MNNIPTKTATTLKRSMQILNGALAASILSFSASAQEAAPARTERTDEVRYGKRHSANPNQLNGAAKASDILGMTVHNYQEEKLGKVDEIALSVETGRIVQVILSTGGFFGVGDSLTAVPPGALHHDVAAGVLHLDATKETLKAAPRFDMSKWAECCDPKNVSMTYRHFGSEPAHWFSNHDGVGTGATFREEARKLDEQVGSTDRNRPVTPVAPTGVAGKASEVIGMPVSNLQGESLGDVENILFDFSAARVVAVVVSSGGFLGIGDELSAVPPSALRFNSERNAFTLDATKELLAKSPHFKADRWPDFSQPSYTEGLYRAYGVQPYFTNSVNTATDIRGRGDRQRNDRALAPFDQGTSDADVGMTAQIRQEIVDLKDMSVNGRNVKVITQNGVVTLRGPVDTAEEKRLIGDIAINIAVLGNVRNQIEVR